jgi:hypothetical protein
VDGRRKLKTKQRRKMRQLQRRCVVEDASPPDKIIISRSNI